MQTYNSFLRCTVAALALGATSPAWAQNAAPAGSAPQSAAETQDENVIYVVAQRRSERLQDVPLSVTALQSDQLAASNVTSTLDLPLITPGLRIDSTAFFVQPAIRGITTTFASATSEANVATYIDGIYQQFTQGAVYNLPDVESVEVLKGPQGTLFGRNATGGAILINTVKPDFDEIKGKVSATYGRFNSAQLRGYVTAPLIVDKLAIGLTGMYDTSDGWKRDLLNNGRRGFGYNDYLVRGKVRFQPADGVDFTLTGLYTKRDDDGVNYSAYKGRNLSQIISSALPVAGAPWTIANDTPTTQNNDQKAVSLHGDIDLGFGTFTTNTAYSKNRTRRLADQDFGAAPASVLRMRTWAENFTQEFLVTTNQLGRVRAVGGLFYYRLSGGAAFDINSHAVNIYYKDEAESIAGFGELTYDITDQLSLTGGLRYSSEKRNSFANMAFRTAVQPPRTPLGEPHTWNAATPRVSLVYKATPDTNLYATYSKGFTSGFFNSLGLQATPVNPEHVSAYEVGVKSSEINNLRVSAAAFYYDYKDLQVLSVITGAGGSPSSIASNAAASEIYGAEFNADWKITPEFSLSLGGTYLHARYKSFPTAAFLVPRVPLPSNPLLGINELQISDASGYRMIRAPTFSGNMVVRYSKETNIGTIDAAATLFYSSKVFHDVSNRVVQPDYALINANLTLQPKNTNFSVGVWGKNLTNHAVISSVSISNNFDAVDYLPPRTYGITLGYTF